LVNKFVCFGKEGRKEGREEGRKEGRSGRMRRRRMMRRGRDKMSVAALEAASVSKRRDPMAVARAGA
jgi:hypothetical protein